MTNPNSSPDLHEHIYGTWQQSRFTGTWHRPCTIPGCKWISLDNDEGDDNDEGESENE